MTNEERTQAMQWFENRAHCGVLPGAAKMARLAIEALTNLEPLPNQPLTHDQLRQMVGRWVWVVVNYENNEAVHQCDGWAKVVTYGTVAYFDQSLKVAELGTRFQAYAQPVSNFGVRTVSRKQDMEHAKPE